MQESYKSHLDYLRTTPARVAAVGLSVFALHSAAEAINPDRTYAETCTTVEISPTESETTCVETETTTIEGDVEVIGPSSDRPSRPKNKGNEESQLERGGNNRPNRSAQSDRPELQGNPNIRPNGTLRYNYNQGDSPWGSMAYRPGTGSGQTYKSSACGQTSMAMVVSNLKNRRITPLDIGRKFPGQKAAGGSLHTLPTVAGRAFGLKSQHVGKNMQPVKRVLTKNDGLAVALVGPGEFTRGGHFITIAWDKNKKEYRVSDPNAKNIKQEKRTYTGSELMRKGNVQKLWTFMPKNNR